MLALKALLMHKGDVKAFKRSVQPRVQSRCSPQECITPSKGFAFARHVEAAYASVKAAASEIGVSCGHVKAKLRSNRLESSQNGCGRIPL